MCLYIYVCVYMCMCVCVSIVVFVCVCMSIYVCVCAYIGVCLCVCVFICVCVYSGVSLCVCISIYVCKTIVVVVLGLCLGWLRFKIQSNKLIISFKILNYHPDFNTLNTDRPLTSINQQRYMLNTPTISHLTPAPPHLTHLNPKQHI